MRNLTLQIHQDQLFEFFQLYRPLSKLQKKIWQLVVWWCKRFPCANPRQEKIAQQAGCSRKHINQTLQLFQKYGWICLVSRGNRRPKILNIPDDLLQIDLVKGEYFKRVEVTAKVTHSYSSYRGFTGRVGEVAKQPKKEIQIPPEIAVLNFSRENSLKLSLLSSFSFQEVKRKCQKMLLSEWRPDKPEEYIVGIGINIAKSRNEKLDWRSYYQQIEKDNRIGSAI